jgi:hypothetical protein
VQSAIDADGNGTRHCYFFSPFLLGVRVRLVKYPKYVVVKTSGQVAASSRSCVSISQVRVHRTCLETTALMKYEACEQNERRFVFVELRKHVA